MKAKGNPAYYARDQFLKDTPVFWNHAACRNLYHADADLSQLHFHDCLEISIVVDGVGMHRVFGQTEECRRGDVYVINTGVPHRYFAKSESEYPIVYNLIFDVRDWFSGSLADPNDPRFCYGIFECNPPCSYAHLSAEELERVMNLYHAVSQEVEGRNTDWKAAAESYLSLLLITLERHVSRAAYTTASVKLKDWLLVSSAIQTVTEQIESGNADMTLEAVAKGLYISKSYLSRLFVKVTGESFSEYVRRVRVLRACRLLSETDLTNAEIAQVCGLKDVQTFYKLFRESTGMTPHFFRSKKMQLDRTSQ